MKDNSRKKTSREQVADTSAKKTVDSVYNLIMANAMFILFNIHILIFLIFFRPESIGMYYLAMGLLSINFLPSYAALFYALRAQKTVKKSVVRLFIEGYRKNVKTGLVIGIIAALLITFSLYNNLFFLIEGMESAYFASQMGIFFTLFATAAAVPVMVHTEGGRLREIFRITKDSFFRLLLSAALALFIMGISIFFARYIVVPLIFGFGLAAMAQDTLSEKILAPKKIQAPKRKVRK